MTPLRLFVDRIVGDFPQAADELAIFANARRGDTRAGGLIHERHELVREARHGAADADAAHVGAAADAAHPSALGHVAVHDRAPAADFDKALGRAVLQREITLFVITGAIA